MSVFGNPRGGLPLRQGHSFPQIKLGTRGQVAELFCLHLLFYRDCLRPVRAGISDVSQGHGEIDLRVACDAEGEVASPGLGILGAAEGESERCANRQEGLARVNDVHCVLFDECLSADLATAIREFVRKR